MDNTIVNQIYSTAVNAASFAAEEISQIDAETALQITAIALPIFAGLAVLAGAVTLLYLYKFRQADSQNKENMVKHIDQNAYSKIYANSHNQKDIKNNSIASCPLMSQVQHAYRPSEGSTNPSSVSATITAENTTQPQHTDFFTMISQNYGVKAPSEIPTPSAKETITYTYQPTISTYEAGYQNILSKISPEINLESTLRSL